MNNPSSRLLAILSTMVLLLAVAVRPGWGITETDVSRPGAGGPPTRVEVDLYLADLFDISGAEQAIVADVVLRAAWHDPRLAGRWDGPTSVDLDAVWHPRLLVANQRGLTPLLPARVEVDPSGRVQYRQRYSGKFSVRMDLRDFPMDRHAFRIQLVCLGYPRSEVDLDYFPEAQRTGRNPRLSITDWEIGAVRMEAADYEAVPGAPRLAGAGLAWEGRRHTRYYVLQIVLPLLLVVLMGWTALWVDPTVIPARMSTSITTMLTLIAYRFALGQQLPRLTYLTRFDYFTLGSTILVFAMLLVVTATAWLIHRQQRALVDRIDIAARIGFPLLFAGICLHFWRG